MYFLEIVWFDGNEGKPKFIGPFSTRKAADRWAIDELKDGSWEVLTLVDPWSASGRDETKDD